MNHLQPLAIVAGSSEIQIIAAWHEWNDYSYRPQRVRQSDPPKAGSQSLFVIDVDAIEPIQLVQHPGKPQRHHYQRTTLTNPL